MRWLFAGSSCHLHSTDTPEFWEEEDEDDTGGSASVSMTAAVSELEDGEEEEEEDEEEAATVPTEQRQDVVMVSLGTMYSSLITMKAEIYASLN